MTTTFAHLGLSEPVSAALSARGFTEPFPIQAASIPDALAGRDICGRAPTGSGKTFAFGLPTISSVGRAGKNRPRALVLVPTRELAAQIKDELHPFAAAAGRRIEAVFGGVGYGPQKHALRRGVDLLIATPGRLEDLIEQRCLDLSGIDVVVLDEADRMADMGFLPAMRRILDAVPSTRQTLLFSATLDGDIAELSRRYQRDPVRHEVGSPETTAADVVQHFWLVHHNERLEQTADVVRSMGRSIVFTRTRHRADRLAKQLARVGVDAVALHGGRSQKQRTAAIRAFSGGHVSALVATDVAARGIDVDDVACVLHFDPAADEKDHTHRSGRTGRAGATGVVVTLVTPEQRRAVEKLIRELGLGASIEKPVPTPVSAGLNTAAESAEGSTDASLYVANLPWSTTSEDLGELFAVHGEVLESTVIRDRRSGRSKGFGFVEMESTEASAAIDALHGAVFGGRDLTVRIARPRAGKG